MSKKILFLSFLILFLTLNIMAIQPIQPVLSEEIIQIGTVGDGANSEQLKAKINNMASEFYTLATNLIVPVTVIILIFAGFTIVFFKEAKNMILYALVGLLIVFWSPFIVQLVVNWVRL